MPIQATVPNGTYRWIAVETFPNTDPYEPSDARVRVRPLPEQGVPTHLRVECARDIRLDYPIGTVFALKAKIIEREGTPLIYSYFKWEYHVLDRETAKGMIKTGTLGFFANAKRFWY